MLTLSLVVGAVLAAGAPPVAGQEARDARDAVDAVVDSILTEGRIPGAAVAILEDGRLVKARGYGLADVEHSVPVTAETIFQSGSLGKQFTAAAVLLLAEDGLLSLADPITRHLAEAPETWSGVTVRHLLSHTGGLAPYERRADFRKDYTEEELVELIGAEPLVFEPGTEWSYSNSGYVVLGALVSRITGGHWGDFMRDRVFGPAGMETARVISEAEIVPHRSSGYRLVDGELRNQGWVSPTFLTTGDGALYLSILDLVRWDQALRRGLVLSEESRRAMWSPTRLADGSEVGYGFGWFVAGEPAPPHVGHGGAWQGFKANIVRYDDPAVTVALLANGAHAGPAAMSDAIVAAYRPGLVPPEPARVELPEAALAAFAGTYLRPEGDTVRIRVEEGGLTLEGMGPRPARLEPVGGSTFVREPTDSRIRFVEGEDGSRQAWIGPPGTPLVRLRRIS